MPSARRTDSGSPWSTLAESRPAWSSAESSRLGRAAIVSVKRISKPSRGSEWPRRGRTQLARLRRATEREILRTSPPELADLTTDFWSRATAVQPVPKKPISLRVDAEVLAWFKAQGPRYQSRTNSVLRAYMAGMKARRRSQAAA